MTVGYTGDAVLDRVVTATPVTLGNAESRFMAGQSVGGTSTLSTSGDDSLYTRVTVNGTLFNSATSTSTYDLAAGTYAPGAVNGSVVLKTTGEGLSGENPINVTVAYMGNALLDRVVTATPITLGNAQGRFMASQSVSGTSTLSTSGDDSLYTRVTVNGTLFNSATTTSTYSLAPATYAAGPVNGSVVLTTSGEGLSGENPINVTVGYLGDAVQNRIVLATSASFGLIHLGQSISEPITLSTTGLDNQFTRVSVNNAGPDGNGLAVSGGVNPLFNGPAVTDNRALSGTPAVVGAISGTIVLSTNGEGLSGESPVPVQVSYSGQVFSGNAQWSGAAGNNSSAANVNYTDSSWAGNANWNDTIAAGVHAAPGIWGVSGDSAALGAGPAGTITLDGANPNLASLSFNNSSASYTLASGSGGTLTMDNSPNPAAVTVVAGSHTIAAPLVLDGITNVAVSNPGDMLTVSGPVGGSGGLTLIGSGTLVLVGSSTYSGGTTISSGLLQVGNNAALGPGTAALAVNGGTLDLHGYSAGLGALGGGGTIDNLSGSGSSCLTIGNTNSSSTFSGTIQNTAGQVSLVKAGAGALVLAGNNTYTGGTTIAGGTLQVGNGGASGAISGDVLDNSCLVLNRADTATLAGNVSGAGGLVQSGAGVFVITGSNAYGGGTTISAGTLQVGNGGASGSLVGSIVNNAALVFNRSDTYTFAGNISGLGALHQSGNGTLTLSGSASCGSTYVDAGTLAICGGTIANLAAAIADNAGSNATVTVTGNGSTWTTSTDLLVGAAGSGALVVESGGSVSSNNVYLGSAVGGSSAVGTLTVNPGGLVAAGSTILDNNGSVNLNGGTIRASTFGGQPMAFNWGTLEYTNNLTVSVSDWLESTLGWGHPVGFAQQLMVDGTTTLNDVLTLSGGTFSTGRLVNPSYLQFINGTFNLTGDNLSISGSGLFGSMLMLPSGNVVNVTNNASIAAGASLSMQGGGFSAATLSNSGAIGGYGQINAPLTNALGGQVRAFAGDHPVFTGGSNVNQGQIQLYGGVVEFTGALTNSPGGLIVGNGSLIVSGGLSNSGIMALSAVTNISGPVQNGPSGLVNTAGGTTTFWNNVVNSGTIYTAGGSFTVFYGGVSGSGAFTGPGTASFEGNVSPGQSPAIVSSASQSTGPGTGSFASDLSPGQSPAAISLASQAYFADTSQINIALAGTIAGRQYDQLAVAGAATLAGGSLNVTLLNGFRPVQNDQFTILTFTSRSGDFGTETGLDLGGRLQLVPTYTNNSLVLTAVQGGSGAWRFDSDGAASVSTNWTSGLPNAAGDTATFGPVITQPRTVTLDEPTVFGQMAFSSPYGYTLSGSGANTLTLNNSGAPGTPGRGATITVSDGQQAIDAPVVLADNLVVTGSGTLTFGSLGGITETGGSRSLTMNGAGGTLILSGTDSYTGGTNVDAGTLYVTNASAIADGTTLIIGAAGVFIYDPSAAGSPGAAVSDEAMSANVVSAVPEPGTLALLLAGLVVWIAARAPCFPGHHRFSGD